MGLNSSGLRPAEESSPMAPLISASTIQKSPPGDDSTRGARSLNSAGTSRVHRSLAGFTWESAEMIRSVAIDAISSGTLLADDAVIDQAFAHMQRRDAGTRSRAKRQDSGRPVRNSSLP